MDWFDLVPKVELHLHLEGAFPISALWQLIEKYGGDPEVTSRAALQERFRLRSFDEFLQGWMWKNSFLREYEDFTFIARALAQDLRRQNIRYAEVFYSPPCFFKQGLEPQPLSEAIRKGLNDVAGIEIQLIADLVRDHGPRIAERTLAQIREVQNQGVVGIGIGGFEAYHPPGPFHEVFAQARRMGFRTSAHAGETLGAESVQVVIDELEVDRVGHATRAIEDEHLLRELAHRKIPLEICPLSNLATGVVHQLQEHPVRHYFEREILITVNTDDPLMFGNSMAAEYRTLVEKFGFTQNEIRQLILNSVEASWLSETRKAELRAIFQSDPVWRTERSRITESKAVPF